MLNAGCGLLVLLVVAVVMVVMVIRTLRARKKTNQNKNPETKYRTKQIPLIVITGGNVHICLQNVLCIHNRFGTM